MEAVERPGAPVRLSTKEAARRVGISANTLRTLERKGVIPKATRTYAGRRYFTLDDVGTIDAIVFPPREDDTRKSA